MLSFYILVDINEFFPQSMADHGLDPEEWVHEQNNFHPWTAFFSRLSPLQCKEPHKCWYFGSLIYQEQHVIWHFGLQQEEGAGKLHSLGGRPSAHNMFIDIHRYGCFSFAEFVKHFCYFSYRQPSFRYVSNRINYRIINFDPVHQSIFGLCFPGKP